MNREGACLSCHKNLPEESLATSFLHHVAKYTGQLPDTNEKHNSLVNKIVMLAAWGTDRVAPCLLPLAADGRFYSLSSASENSW